MDGWRDRLAALGRRELVVGCGIAVVLVGAGSLWYVRSLPEPVRTIEVRGHEPVPGPTATAPPPIFVHVAGEVARPGVFEMASGDRVIDAIERAGGATSKADLGLLNLAAILIDAQQVLVPKRGQESTTIVPGAPAGGAGAQGLVNLNTAGTSELETLPGIGPVLAQRIVEYRQREGPFASVDQLMEVSGIGEKRLEDIRPRVTV